MEEFDEVSALVRQARRSGLVTYNKRAGDWAKIMDSMSGDERLIKILSDIEPMEFKIEFAKEFDPEDAMMRPYLKSDWLKPAIAPRRGLAIAVYPGIELPKDGISHVVLDSKLSSRPVNWDKSEDTSRYWRAEMIRVYNDWIFNSENDGKILYTREPYAADAMMVPIVRQKDGKSGVKQGVESTSIDPTLQHWYDVAKRRKVQMFEKLDDAKSYLRRGFTKVGATIWRDQIVTRASYESAIKFPKKFRTMIAVARATMGPAFKDSIYIRMLKYYVDKFGGKPFFEGTDGNVNVDTDPDSSSNFADSAAPTRCLLLLNAAYMHWEDKYDVTYRPMRPGEKHPTAISVALHEYVMWLFRDPWVHIDMWKGMKAGLTDMMMAGATKGHMCNWGGASNELSEYQLKPIRDEYLFREVNGRNYPVYHNDEEVIKAKDSEKTDGKLTGGLMYELKLLRDAGLEENANVYQTMLGAPVTEWGMRLVSIFSFNDPILGFMRTGKDPSFRKQIASAKEKKPDYPVKKYITKVVRDLINAARGKFPVNTSEYERRLPAHMNTKSAGVGTFYIDVSYDGKELKMPQRSKWLDYLTRFREIQDKEHVKLVLTVSLPGVTFSRNVQSRFTRLILGGPTPQYALEAYIVPYILAEMAKMPEFTITKESGVTIDDHFIEMVETSNPMSWLLTVDYSAFDAHENYDNFRSAVIEGMKMGFTDIQLSRIEKTEARGFDQYSGYAEIVDTLYANIEHALYVTDDGGVLITDMNMSGEFATIVNNNIMNKALFQYMRSEMPSRLSWYRACLNWVSTTFQGDDSISVINALKNNGALTKEQITEFINVVVDVADENNQEINFKKTMFMRFSSAYLKKTVKYGYYIPLRHQMARWSKEKATVSGPVMTILSGLHQTYSEGASRGQGHQSNADLLCFVSIEFCKVKGESGDSRVQFDLPFSAVYTPMELGGAGIALRSLAGASKGPAIYLAANEVERRVMDINAFLMKAGAKASNDEVVEAIMESKQIKEGVAYLASVMDSGRVTRSEEAQARLKAIGLRGVASPYKTYARNLTTRVVEDTSTSSSIMLEANYRLNAKVALARKDLAHHRRAARAVLVYGADLDVLRNVSTINAVHDDFNIHQLWSERKGASLEDMVEVAAVCGQDIIIYSTRDIEGDFDQKMKLVHIYEERDIIVSSDADVRKSGLTNYVLDSGAPSGVYVRSAQADIDELKASRYYAIIPAGSGKTTFARRYASQGYNDVDDILKPFDGMTGELKIHKLWAELSAMQRNAIRSARWTGLLLLHSEAMVPEEDKEKIIFSGKVSAAVQEEVVKERHKSNKLWGDLSKLNWETSKAVEYESHASLDRALFNAFSQTGYQKLSDQTRRNRELRMKYPNHAELDVFGDATGEDDEVHLSDDINRYKSAASKILARSKKDSRARKILKRYGKEEFDFLRGVTIEYGEDVPITMPVSPIQSLDHDIDLMIRQIGTSIGGDNLALKTAAVFSKVTGDPEFPKTISDSEIYHELTKPGVAGFTDRMILALVAMGATEGNASALVVEWEKIASRYVFVNKLSSYSTRDGILGHLNLSRSRYQKIVSVPSLGNSQLESTLQSIGFLCMIIDGFRPSGHVRTARVRVLGQLVPQLLDTIKVHKNLVGRDVSAYPPYLI